MINEHKKGVKAMKYTAKPKSANPVAKHAGSTTTSSAGAHYQGQDQKKKAKHGEVKHKNKAMDLAEDHHNPEYDDEAGMADNNLETLKRAVDGIDDVINQGDNLPEWCQEKIAVAKSMLVTVWDYMLSEKESEVMEAKKGLYYYVNKRKKAGTSRSNNHPDAPSAQDWKDAAKTAKKESIDLEEEFDLIESNINRLAVYNNVDAESIWEDLQSLTDDELYVFAVTIPLTEDWQKVNKRDKTDGMSQKAVNAYRRENPGSKLKTAVTTKPSKLKRGSKASKRRGSYCSRSRGQMKMHSINCSKTPDKAICKARRRWNCESIEFNTSQSKLSVTEDSNWYEFRLATLLNEELKKK